MAFHLNNTLLKQRPKNGKYYLVAIDGRGGAGKTTLTGYIAKLLPDFTIINGDDYFEPDATTIAFGSFNDERFFKDVIQHIQNTETTIPYRPYDWHNEPHITQKDLTITTGLVIERSYSLSFDLDWDFTIWVETPQDIALQRGQDRDEMPLDEGLKQWEEVWQPKENAHYDKVNPLKTANLVIDGLKPFEQQID